MFAGIAGKPAELTVTALIRARFCELAGLTAGRANSAELFTLGLFSVIDALMDIPIGEVLDRIPFPQDMRDALISHDGDKGLLLDASPRSRSVTLDHAETIIPNVNELYLTRSPGPTKPPRHCLQTLRRSPHKKANPDPSAWEVVPGLVEL